MANLTEAEQQFFATGDASVLQQQTPAPTPAPDAAPSPVDLSGLGNAPAAPAPIAAPAAPAATPAPVPAPEVKAESAQLPDVAEILRRNLADAQQRVAQLEQEQKTLQQQPAKQVQEPDPAEDPYGSLMFKISKIQEQLQALNQQQQTSSQQQTQLQQYNAFREQVLTLRNEFAKTHADFQDAYNHLRATREADLKMLGLNPQQISQQILQEEFALSQTAVQQARNPAEVIYEMSKRHGYTPKQAASSQTPAEQAAAIERAQASAKSFSPQPNADQDLTVEGLKNASEADLNKLVLDPKAWSKITGADQYPL